MKKTFSLLLLMLFSIVNCWAEFNPTTGKMYALKETTSGLFLDIQTLGINEPGHTTNSMSLHVNPCAIYFEASNGKWKIKNINGTYAGNFTSGRTWNTTISETAFEWIINEVDGDITIAKDASNYIGWDKSKTITAGSALYNNAEDGNKDAARIHFTLVEYSGSKLEQGYYTLKSASGTYFNFTKHSTGTAASFQNNASQLYLMPSVNTFVFEDKSAAGKYISTNGSGWNVTTTVPTLWDINNVDENGFVSILRHGDTTKALGSDQNTNVDTGIFTNVGPGCNKWYLVGTFEYPTEGTIKNSNYEFTSEKIRYYNPCNKLCFTLTESGAFFQNGKKRMSLDEFVLYDANGEKVILTAENVTGNNGKTYEGMFDGVNDKYAGTKTWSDGTEDDWFEILLPNDIDLGGAFSFSFVTENTTMNAKAFKIETSYQKIKVDYTLDIINAPSDVTVTYNGQIISADEPVNIDKFDEALFTATNIDGYYWTVTLDEKNEKIILEYKKFYTFEINNAPNNDIKVTYDGNALKAGDAIKLEEFYAGKVSATDVKGYIWQVLVDQENYTITLLYKPETQSIVDLVNRIGGAGTDANFKFVLDSKLSPTQEMFVLDTEDGKILIKGTTISAITTGLGWYFNNIAKVNIAWNALNETTAKGGAYVNLTNTTLPRPETEEHVCDAKYRYYLNYCTFGYSMTSWTWARWQQEIDWMALHGINMPLQIVGLEEVWRKFLTLEDSDGKRKYGYTDEEAKAFVPGPAFTAWWGMNNLEGWGGTAPGTKSGGTWAGAGGVQDDAWYVRQKNLAWNIVERQRELGMQPVLPGWSGMVPTNFASKSGYATRSNGGNWAGDFVRPLLLNVNIGADKYAKIAADYYKCLNEVMGESQYYSMDPFHEGGGTGTMKDYEALYAAMEAAKSGSQWVIQQWQWSATQAYSLTAVPEGRLVVLDLFSDGSPAFDKYTGYSPQDAVFCAIPNFGGRSGLMGRLQNVTDNYFNYKSKYASIKGIGTAPEAIEQTPVTYDLIYQLPWMNGTKPNVEEWVNNYAVARYGQDNKVVKEAWSLLRQGPLSYGADGIQGPVEDVWAARPNLNASPASAWGKTINHAGGTYTKARRQMLIDAVYKLLGQKDALNLTSGSVFESNYNYDLVEFGGAVMADYAYDLLLGIKAAKNAAGENFANDNIYKARRDAFLQLILDMDAFRGTNLNFRLGKWTQEARAAAGEVEGATSATADWYEYNNARTILTTWSSPGTNLTDYSYRSWQGLLKDYYYPRWKYYFDNNCNNGEYKFFEWNWAHGMTHKVGDSGISTTPLKKGEVGHTDSYTREPEGNTIEKATEMLGKYIIPVTVNGRTHYAYRYLDNDISSMATIPTSAGATIDLTPYFGKLTGINSFTSDAVSGTVTDLSKVAIKADAADGAHSATITLNDGTKLTFYFSINPAFNSVYTINYKNGNADAAVFLGYNEDKDNNGNVGYKLIATGTYSTTAAGDKYFTITPSGAGFSISAQGKYLKSPNLNAWNHLMFSDNAAEAGVYLFEEVETGLFKMRDPNNEDKIKYVNDYDKLVFGNDKAGKENLSTFTLTKAETFPFSVSEAGMATLCLPFNVKMADGMYAYDLAIEGIDQEGNDEVYNCTMRAIAGPGQTLKAGTPVIIGANEGKYNLAITMDNNKAGTSLNGSLLKGNFVKQDLTQSGDKVKFIFAKRNEVVGFYRLSSGTSEIGANKCWLEWDVPTLGNPAQTIRLAFDDVTEITQVDGSNMPVVIYNLQGIRIKAPQPGLNIINGKKVFIKK